MITRRAALGGLGASVFGASAARAILPAPFPPPELSGALTQGGWARGRVQGAPKITLDDQSLAYDSDGDVLVCFDRDAPATAILKIDYGTTGRRQVALTIAPRAWHIEHVDAPFHPPAMPDEAFARLRAAEMAQINAARARNAVSDGWRQTFQWPGRGRISGLFGSQRTYQGGVAGSYHSGTDIALAAGTPYAAPADGVVVLAADHPFTLEGNLLMVDHGMGLTSAFLHSSSLLVKVGDRVAQGQPIGHVGMTGRATGPHLHWSLRWREARLDPMLLAGAMV